MGFSRQEYWSGLPFSYPVTTFCQNSPPWPVSLGWPYMAWLIVSLSLTRLWSMWSDWLVFCDCGFQSVCPLTEKDRGLLELPDGRDWLRGKLGLVLMGGAMLSKSLIQFSVDGWSDLHGVALFLFLNYYYFTFGPCSIVVPWPGISLMPSALELWSPNCWTTREVPGVALLLLTLIIILY